MMNKLKFLLLIPLSLPLYSCSGDDKISFKCGSDTFTTYYNDRYFDMPNNELHEEIALASHAMALATFNGDEDYEKRSYDLRDLWKKEGFEHLYFNYSFYQEPGTDTIGFGIASKEIQLLGGKYTLVAVAVRGGNYGAEWTSNFTIGSEGNSKGFDGASDQVVEGLSYFLDTYKVEGRVKFWISGFSRAAITSNMTAGKILNKMEGGEYLTNKVHYTADDMYAYCFEPPLGVYTSDEAARGDLYHGIYNFLNYNDLVPLVAPHEYGFTRYGTDYYYPDRLTDIYFDETEREKLISQYHFSWGAQNFPKYTVDEWKFFDVGGDYAELYNLPRISLHPSQGRFCRDLIHELSLNGFGTRHIYSSFLEKGIRELFITIMGKNEDIEGIDTSKILDIIFEYAFIKSIINELENNDATAFAMDVEMLFLQLFGANEDNIDVVKKLYEDNFYLLTLFAEGLRYRQDITAQLLYRDNAMNIVIGHMPQLSYSFLSSCDTRLHGNDACKFNDGTYHVLHIKEPTKFALYEKNLGKIVFQYDEEGMRSDHLAAELYSDYSISVYLPKNGDYEYIGNFDSLTLGNVNNEGQIETVQTGLPLEGSI